MTPHERFLKLIVDFAGPGPEGVLELVQNEMTLDADGPVRLVLEEQREEIVFSTLIYCAEGEPELLDDEIVADFNAYHLFHGGFRLSIDRDFECLYIVQTNSLARMEAVGLDAFFEDFITRCANCTRWYMAEIDLEEADEDEIAVLAPA